LLEIRRLPITTARKILEERDRCGPYRDIEDLSRRTHVTSIECELLLGAGALDCFGEPRPMLSWRIKGLSNHNRVDGEEWLFQGEYSLGVPQLPDFSARFRMRQEWDACGWLLSAHPLQYYGAEIGRYGAMLSDALPEYDGRQITLAGWLIAERRVAVKGSGCMKFLTFEDLEGIFEAVLFPAVYNRFGHLLTSHGPYIVTGVVQNEYGAYSVSVTGLKRIEIAQAEENAEGRNRPHQLEGRNTGVMRS
jgi:DNA polymerase III alpha subunit